MYLPISLVVFCTRTSYRRSLYGQSCITRGATITSRSSYKFSFPPRLRTPFPFSITRAKTWRKRSEASDVQFQIKKLEEIISTLFLFHYPTLAMRKVLYKVSGTYLSIYSCRYLLTLAFQLWSVVSVIFKFLENMQ